MILGRLFHHFPALDWCLRFIYMSLMLAISLLYLALPSSTVRRRFVGAVALTCFALLPLYVLFPGAGPVYLLREDFPWRIPNMSPLHTIFLPHIPLNVAPSGHVTWAVLMFWFARQYCGRVVQIATGVFAVLTAVATLGIGEHYVIDLVLALPFAAGLWALVHRQWRFGLISMVVVTAWLVALREGWALTMPPVAVWFWTGITLAIFTLYPADGTSDKTRMRSVY
jgi:hypothetical protein